MFFLRLQNDVFLILLVPKKKNTSYFSASLQNFELHTPSLRTACLA